LVRALGGTIKLNGVSCGQLAAGLRASSPPMAAAPLFSPLPSSLPSSSSSPTPPSVRASGAALAAEAEDLDGDGLVHGVAALSPAFCAALVAEVGQVAARLRALADKGAGATAAGQEQDGEAAEARRLLGRPLPLDQLGLGWLADVLFFGLASPLSGLAFPAEAGSAGRLDWRHAYVVGYGQPARAPPGATSTAAAAATNTAGAPPAAPVTRTGLVQHTDDSEVTLNVGLGSPGFEGGDVVFGGLRGTRPRAMDALGGDLGDHGDCGGGGSEASEGGEGGGSGGGEGAEGACRVRPVVGRGVLHLGRHLHAVSPVLRGERFALILWARALGGVRSEVCPCCWMNRREHAQGKGSSGGTSCICGPDWN
jgi:hypothetical protein